MTGSEEALSLMHKMVATGEVDTMGDAYTLVGKRYPNLMQKARQEQTKVAANTAPQHVHVSDPPGIKKSWDGTVAPWAEQVEYWRKHPDQRRQYENHFRR